MVNRTSHLVHNSVFAPFIEAVRERGGNPEAILSEVGVPERMIGSESGYVPVRAWYDYVDKASEILQAPYLGFEIGIGIDWGGFPSFRSIDPYGDTLGTSLWKLMVDADNFATYATWSLEIGKDRTELTVRRKFRPRRPPGQLDAYGVGFFIRLLQSATGSAFSLCQYSAEVSAPQAIPPAFSKEMRLRRGSNQRASHSFPSEWAFTTWSAPRNAENSGLNGIALQTIQTALRQHLLQGTASVAELARLFGTSERSFQRQLKGLGTSFRDELRQGRLSIAKQLLRDTERSVDEIADQLGFSQPSSFRRAFRDWTGGTPSEFRSRQE